MIFRSPGFRSLNWRGIALGRVLKPGLRKSRPKLSCRMATCVRDFRARNLTQPSESILAVDWDFPAEYWKRLDETISSPIESRRDFQVFVDPITHGDRRKH